MRLRFRPKLVIALLVLVTATGPLGAQRMDKPPRRPSHVPLPPLKDGPSPEQLLQQRLLEQKERGEFDDLLRRILENPKEFGLDEEFLKKHGYDGSKPLPIDPDSPEFQKKILEKIKEIEKDPGKQPLDDKQKEMLNRLKDRFDKNSTTKPKAKIDDPAGKMEPPFFPEKPAKSKWPAPSWPNPTGNGNGDVDSKSRQEAADQMLRWAKSLEKTPAPLRESPSIQKAVRELSKRSLERAAEGKNDKNDGADWQLARFNDFAKQGGDWLEKRFEGADTKPGKTKGNFGGPPRTSSPNVSTPQVGGIDSGPLAATAEIWPLVLFALAFVVAALVMWKLLLSRKNPFAKTGDQPWHPGPWPVDPAGCRTRAEVVQAFEHLSLVRLGLVARPCHHWDLADQLGAGTHDRLAVARELAKVYEQARYAPPHESLREGDLAAARRDLCLLAGDAAA